MVLAFILNITMAGEPKDIEVKYFKNSERCDWFASVIEMSNEYDESLQIKAWCEEGQVNENEVFWD